MDKKVLDWLLAGPAWLRYAVELQLLDARPDVTPVLQDSAIQKIIARLKGSTAGIPALKTGKVHYTETGKAYWDLFFLADIGLNARDSGLDSEVGRRYSAFSRAMVLSPSPPMSRITISACRQFFFLRWQRWAFVMTLAWQNTLFWFLIRGAMTAAGIATTTAQAGWRWSPAPWTT